LLDFAIRTILSGGLKRKDFQAKRNLSDVEAEGKNALLDIICA
jgi:hypothetical protein